MRTFKILLILCSLFIYSASFADDDYEEHYKHQEDDRDHIFRSLEYLHLSKQQYSEIKEVLINYKKAYQKFYTFQSEKQKKLQDIMQEDIFDKTLYSKIHADIQTRLIRLEADKFQRIHAILTPNQRQKFSYFMQEWERD